MRTTQLETLSHILTTSENRDRIVAQSDQGTHSLGELQKRVACLVEQLEQWPNANRWILSCSSTWGAALALLALSHCNKHILLPQNSQPGTLHKLASMADGFVGDGPFEAGSLPSLNPLLGEAKPPLPTSNINPDDIRISLFTSGSTGEGKQVDKRLSQLTSEVENLATKWEESCAGCVTFSTVSHQHIYGLLFGLLWPLMAGRTLTSSSQRSPEALVSDIVASEKAVLVSCPAHLSRFPELVRFERIQPHVTMIFSSGGPLHRNDALRVAHLTKQTPIEVFGSTETGGVAWRQQTEEQEVPLWTPFSPVDVRQAPDVQGLQVRSTFASWQGKEWLTMGDNVTFYDDGTFAHQGRADRIVKLEQKRVSLPMLEAHLNEHPWVKESSLCVTQRATGREVLAAVVALSVEGKQELASQGSKKLRAGFKAHLVRHVEQEVLPKRWAWVNALPRNAQGKVTQDAVLAYFQPTSSRWPTVLEFHAEAQQRTWTLHVPEPYLYCDGHFEEQAIVPGVVQLQWVLHFASQALAASVQVTQMEAIKFQHILCPGDTCTLQMELNLEKPKLRFKLSKNDTVYSSGRFVFTQEGDAPHA
ncbi:MAG: hypothetical protein EP343_30520 [Deltaproteobacteria bacterium]|nr:MAG: hypothetical protein EP343_30520 [Deltaproteobacteria bacterium]